MSTAKPGPSAPVRQSATWRQPDSPARLRPELARQPTGWRQKALRAAEQQRLVGRDAREGDRRLACRRAAYSASRPSFHVMRWSCQIPSHIISATLRDQHVEDRRQDRCRTGAGGYPPLTAWAIFGRRNMPLAIRRHAPGSARWLRHPQHDCTQKGGCTVSQHRADADDRAEISVRNAAGPSPTLNGSMIEPAGRQDRYACRRTSARRMRAQASRDRRSWRIAAGMADQRGAMHQGSRNISTGPASSPTLKRCLKSKACRSVAISRHSATGFVDHDADTTAPDRRRRSAGRYSRRRAITGVCSAAT